MSGIHAQHGEPAHKGLTPLAGCIICIVALSALGAILLEAGTLFGSFSHSVRDLSAWMPKRMIVFFLLLLVPNALLTRAIARGSIQERVVALKNNSDALRLRLGINFACVAGGVALGILVGNLISHLLGKAYDPRHAVFFASIAVAASLLVANHKLIKTHLEWGFVILALCFGSMFCLFMPTAAEVSWDGQIHFNSANALSYVFDAEYTGADVLMTQAGAEGALYVLHDLEEIEYHKVELDSRDVSFPHPDLDLATIDHANDVLRQAEAEQDVACMLGTNTYPQGSYVAATALGRIPNAVGLWLGRLLHLDCVGRYTLSRFSNMAFYIVVFFFAIRCLKAGKAIMTVIGLCPTSLFLAANFSYDPWSTGLLSLSVALFVSSLQRQQALRARDTIRYIVPFVLGVYVRAVLFPLALLFAVVPRRYFVNGKEWAKHLALVSLGVVLLLSSFAIPYATALSAGESQGDARGGSDVNVGGQIGYVIKHPLKTLGMSIMFALKMLNPANLGLALDPSDENLMCYFPYLVHSEAPLTEMLAPAEFLLLAVVSILDGSKEDEAFALPRFKVGGIVSFLLGFALICGSMYAGFTAVGRDTISGVQQRYLLGLLALLILPTFNTALRRSGHRPQMPTACMVAEYVLLVLVAWNSFLWAF